MTLFKPFSNRLFVQNIDFCFYLRNILESPKFTQVEKIFNLQPPPKKDQNLKNGAINGVA